MSTTMSSVATKQATEKQQQSSQVTSQQSTQSTTTQTWVWAICGHRGRSTKHTCGSPNCNAIWGW